MGRKFVGRMVGRRVLVIGCSALSDRIDERNKMDEDISVGIGCSSWSDDDASQQRTFFFSQNKVRVIK
jgi:hypothetical protein